MKLIERSKLLEKRQTDSLRGLAMIMIIIQHIYVQMGSTPRTIIPLSGLGYVGTGIFFFLSGYGLFVSYSKHEKNFGHFGWLLKKIKKLLIPFCFAFGIFIVCTTVYFPEKLSFERAVDFLTLTIPFTTTWFLKVILGVYLFFFVVFRQKRLYNHYKVLILSIICIAYFFICYVTMPDFWYTSILNFPLGLLFGLFYDRLKIIGGGARVMALFIISIFVYKYIPMTEAYIPSLLLSLCFVYGLTYVRISCFALNYIGSNSLNFYLFQMIWLPVGHVYFTAWIPYALFVFFMTTLSSILFTNVLKLNKL